MQVLYLIRKDKVPRQALLHKENVKKSQLINENDQMSHDAGLGK